MRTLTPRAVALHAGLALCIALPAGAAGTDEGNVRQRHVAGHGVPERYAGMEAPGAGAGRLALGGRVYQEQCAKCHGHSGQGDGEYGAYAAIQPADLTATMARDDVSDGYLFWAVAEGGAPVGSTMPAYGADLAPARIWAVIEYLRAGLPPLE